MQRDLPFDKREYATVIEALQSLPCDGLTKGQAKTVRWFLRKIFAGRYFDSASQSERWFSAPDGTITFRVAELARVLDRNPKTVKNWLRWARSTGVVETSVDCDELGRKRTTLTFIFSELRGTKGHPIPHQRESDSTPKGIDFQTKGHPFPDQRASAPIAIKGTRAPIRLIRVNKRTYVPPVDFSLDEVQRFADANHEGYRVAAQRMKSATMNPDHRIGYWRACYWAYTQEHGASVALQIWKAVAAARAARGRIEKPKGLLFSVCKKLSGMDDASFSKIWDSIPSEPVREA